MNITGPLQSVTDTMDMSDDADLDPFVGFVMQFKPFVIIILVQTIARRVNRMSLFLEEDVPALWLQLFDYISGRNAKQKRLASDVERASVKAMPVSTYFDHYHGFGTTVISEKDGRVLIDTIEMVQRSIQEEVETMTREELEDRFIEVTQESVDDEHAQLTQAELLKIGVRVCRNSIQDKLEEIEEMSHLDRVEMAVKIPSRVTNTKSATSPIVEKAGPRPRQTRFAGSVFFNIFRPPRPTSHSSSASSVRLGPHNETDRASVRSMTEKGSYFGATLASLRGEPTAASIRGSLAEGMGVTRRRPHRSGSGDEFSTYSAVPDSIGERRMSVF